MNNAFAWIGILIWAIVACSAFIDTLKLREREELDLRLQHYGRSDLLDDRDWAAKGYSETQDKEGEDEDNDE